MVPLDLMALILVGFGKALDFVQRARRDWCVDSIIVFMGTQHRARRCRICRWYCHTVQNLIQILQVRHLTSRWHYRADVAWIILISIVVASLGLTWWALSAQDDWLR